MIPERVSLRGFLSYEDEQVLTFTSAPLWLLAGPNGSGKSSVFDAMTLALFGGHRGGKDDYLELINKRSDTAAIEFDFQLDGELYRIRRTLKRNKRGGATSGQQVMWWRSQPNSSGSWEAVPDTGRRAGFDGWVQEHIGLTYDTFTASVLLVQGRAESLLTSDPKDRHRMLARIVGLERYEQLHARAVLERTSLDAQAASLQQRLGVLTEVTQDELDQAEETVRATETSLAQASVEVERLHALEVLARRWTELQDNLARTHSRLDQLTALLEQQALIERAWHRVELLRVTLPSLKQAVEQLDRLRASEHEVHQLRQRLDELQGASDHKQQALEQLEQKRVLSEQELATNEEQRMSLANELTVLAAAVPVLRGLARDREQLRQASTAAATALEIERTALTAVRQHEIELAAQSQRLMEAAAARLAADHDVTRAATLLEAVRGRSERFLSVVGEKLCRYCGQTLTPAHVAVEKARLDTELAAALADQQKFISERDSRLATERGLERHVATLTAERDGSQRQAAECRLRYEQAITLAERQRVACDRSFAELPASFGQQIASAPPDDWSATSYPTSRDLEAVRGNQERMTKEAGALDKSIRERRAALATLQVERKQLEHAREEARGQLDDAAKRFAVQETVSATCRHTLTTALSQLPPSLELTQEGVTGNQLVALRAELGQLEAQGIATRYRELATARETRASLHDHRHIIQNQLEDIPAPARCQPADVQALLITARRSQQESTQAVLQAKNQRQRLGELQAEHRRLSAERSDFLKRLHVATLLAKYLDRDWLQRYLMRQAEQSIVAYARDILDRLSAGQLHLQLRSGELGGEKALVLETLKQGSEPTQPHRVEMLSGSERFRVAVSLALAIGQYASRQHRPIQSVIIDEGFGCLDPTNRQLMIQELHNLQGQLQRILLVSHQEEFADAFTNGYRFEIVDSASQVRRFGQ